MIACRFYYAYLLHYAAGITFLMTLFYLYKFNKFRMKTEKKIEQTKPRDCASFRTEYIFFIDTIKK